MSHQVSNIHKERNIPTLFKGNVADSRIFVAMPPGSLTRV
jgi:hypothetical protein